jgi:uncharacterized SAM-binding protein YcdF (DUF218 family)
MSWFITNLIATFLLPPLSLLLVLALGIFLFRRRPKLAKILILAAFGLLWMASTPYFAEGALHLLEARTTALDIRRQNADAIVILGGGTYFHAPEYAGQDMVADGSLVRLRYGAKLQRETGKPILVTGGKPLGNSISEAQQMRSALEQDFHVPVRWTEDECPAFFSHAASCGDTQNLSRHPRLAYAALRRHIPPCRIRSRRSSHRFHYALSDRLAGIPAAR